MAKYTIEVSDPLVVASIQMQSVISGVSENEVIQSFFERSLAEGVAENSTGAGAAKGNQAASTASRASTKAAKKSARRRRRRSRRAHSLDKAFHNLCPICNERYRNSALAMHMPACARRKGWALRDLIACMDASLVGCMPALVRRAEEEERHLAKLVRQKEARTATTFPEPAS